MDAFNLYMAMKSDGMLYEVCPFAVGNWKDDKKEFIRWYNRTRK